MGGFHGGHSSHGGGFHGGHSFSGGFHGGSSAPHPIRVYHIHGRIYTRPHYGTINGKEVPFLASLVITLAFSLFGVLILVFGLHHRCDARVTSAWQVAGTNYEKYTFEYTFLGKTYTGYGDDDMKSVPDVSVTQDDNGSMIVEWDSSSSSTGQLFTHFELDIKEGDVYPVYVSLIAPADYHFESDNGGIIFISSSLIVIGLVISVCNFISYRKYKKALQEIGDVNGDGVIDEKDLEAAEAKSKLEETTKLCPYCGARLEKTVTTCPQCGASHI